MQNNSKPICAPLGRRLLFPQWRGYGDRAVALLKD
jgi:hypothetical protein